MESREEIIKRIGRSPDYGSAIINAQIDTPKRHIMQTINASAADVITTLTRSVNRKRG